MSDFFTEYQEELRKLARRIAVEKVRPRAAECDRTGTAAGGDGPALGHHL